MALRKDTKEEIKIAVEQVVNGKLDKIHETMENHMKKENERWNSIQPAIDLIEGAVVAKKITVWTAGFIAASASIYTIIKSIISFK